jgi:hypothetical protein
MSKHVTGIPADAPANGFQRFMGRCPVYESLLEHHRVEK